MENVTHTPKYEVVFFDLYGTLIDIRTDEQCDAAWQALYDTACELGAQYDSVEALRERFEKLEAREMLHQSNHAIVRNGWDEFDVLPVYRSLLMNRNDEAERLLALPQAAQKAAWAFRQGSTVYTRGELEALHAVCKARHLPLFIDGARLGAALYSPVCDYTLADMAHMCEVFTIGGTKMGLLFGEAAVFSAPELAKDFRYFIKQNGGMLAKGRLLGVQFYAAFKDGLYDRIGAEEVRLALRLRDGFRARGWTFLVESPSNQQFPILPDALIERLKPEFSCSHTQSFPNGMSAVRFCTSWATTDADIDALLDAVPINA